MSSGEWLNQQFIEHLREKYNLIIRDSTLQHHEKKGLLTPKRSEGNYRIYTEPDIKTVLKVYLLNKYLGIGLNEINCIEGKPVKKSRKQMPENGPDYLYKLLSEPKLRMVTLSYHQLHAAAEVNELLVDQLLQYRNSYPSDWYDRIDWYDLYSQTLKQQTPKVVPKLSGDALSEELTSYIETLNIDQLIEDVIEELSDEYYYDVMDELIDEYDLPDDSEIEDLEPEMEEAFYEKLEEWLHQNAEDVFIEKMESLLDTKAKAIITRLSGQIGETELGHYIDLLIEMIEDEIGKVYQGVKSSFISKFRDKYDEKYQTIHPIDAEVLSIVLFGKHLPMLLFSPEFTESEWYQEYVDRNYSAIKKCVKEIERLYRRPEHRGMFTLIDVPNREQVVLDLAKKYELEILNLL